MNKVDLRRSFLHQRQSLSIAEWQFKSEQICTHLQAAPLFQRAKTVLAYFRTRQEPDLGPLFNSHPGNCQRQWGFPRCVDQSLSWYFWSANSSLPLQRGRYGILEPHPQAPQVDPDTVDLILIPAVACDMQGYRLGYGGGFYDRLLSLSAWANKFTIGVTFEFAKVPQLPYDIWDQPLKAVCTEAGLEFIG